MKWFAPNVGTSSGRCSIPGTGTLHLCLSLAVWLGLGMKTSWLGSGEKTTCLQNYYCLGFKKHDFAGLKQHKITVTVVNSVTSVPQLVKSTYC